MISTRKALQTVRETTSHHAALQRSAMRQRDWNHSFTLVLFVLFVGTMLCAIVVGSHSYQRLQGQVDQVNERRLSLDVMANTLRAGDSRGAIGVGEGPEGKSLVVSELLGEDGYETRFYLYEGKLLQEYALAGTQCTPEKATELAETQSFSFDYDSATGLLTILTDQGTRAIALRSTQGGER